ncbi:MAG TPA: YbaN family protein [Candidatus Merdibacter merdavium]|uniref:YbaN family protein n=1 Tax=Candidatus Merdibacter merdavium TaxID=2838692 RepID=A0A9D2NSH8_9FIRM|nr:YbaN family protein [Candidatus Merdibacter merdavium]
MRTIYILCGIAAFALGTLGTVLPILPTVPFYLLATWCFAKSSRRLHDWLNAKPLYQKHMTPFFNGEGLSIRQKVTMMSITTIMMTIAFIMMDEIMIGRIVLICAWLFHVFYFIFRIKTRTVR